MTDLTAIITKALQDNLGWDWPGEDHGDVCSHGGPMRVPSAKEVIDDLAQDIAAAIREAATITSANIGDYCCNGTLIRSVESGTVYLHVNRHWQQVWGLPKDPTSGYIELPALVLWTPEAQR